MDSYEKLICSKKHNNGNDHVDHSNDPFNPLINVTMQMSCILVMSHFFYLLFKPLGMTGPISQILAGMVLSPALLSRVKVVEDFFVQTSFASYYSFFTFLFRTAFMFLIGLECDTEFLKRNLHKASIISGFVILTGFITAAVSSWVIMMELKIQSKGFLFSLVFFVLLSNSASPIAVRVVTDMKLDTSDVGRLAISSALIIEMMCILIYTIISSFSSGTMFKDFFLIALFTTGLLVLNKYLAPWFNTLYQTEKYLTKSQVLVFFLLILILSTFTESKGYSSALPIFVLGLTFPREGKSARTLWHSLTFPVHEFIFPVFFGYVGFNFFITTLDRHDYHVLFLILLCSFTAKLIGVLAACHYQKIPRNEGVFLTFILSLKGHSEVLLINVTPGAKTWWNPRVRDLFMTSIVINTLISGSLASYLLRKEERSFAHKQTKIDTHSTQSELRTLSCVYGPRHATGAIVIVSALGGCKENAPLTPHLMHLVELPKKRKTNLMYHQLEDGEQFDDEDYYASNDSLEINEKLDDFTKESKIFIRQLKVVSYLSNIHEDVCNEAEDLRVSIIFLPFHKHQRIDGKIKNAGEGIRTTNQRILRHAPCSVGILVDRNQTGFQQPHGSQSVQHVATLFFGGPDDREALALSQWISLQPQVNLTIIRFLPVSTTEQTQIKNASHENNEVLMAISTDDTEKERDNVSMERFYNRYVISGQVGYIEKYVNDGAQTLETLNDMREMYSLFVVGKGQGDSPLTTGMRDWEECPELGLVGDLLASSDIDYNASILVIQKHKDSYKYPFSE